MQKQMNIYDLIKTGVHFVLNTIHSNLIIHDYVCDNALRVTNIVRSTKLHKVEVSKACIYLFILTIKWPVIVLDTYPENVVEEQSSQQDTTG